MAESLLSMEINALVMPRIVILVTHRSHCFGGYPLVITLQGCVIIRTPLRFPHCLGHALRCFELGFGNIDVREIIETPLLPGANRL